MNQLSKLYPHQELILQRLKDSIRSGKRRPMVMAPTGSGKTVLAARIVTGALAKRNRVAFIAPMISLIDQTFDRFRANGIDPSDMGIIQADHEWHRPHAQVQICSVATLARRGMPDVDMIIVDEAHVRDAKLHEWMDSDEGRKVLAIGLSATPFAKGLGRVYDDLIAPVSMQELIDAGYLSDFKVFAPSRPDLSGIKMDAKTGDYQTTPLSERMSKPQIVADVVGNWLEKGQNMPTLCFAVDRAHAAVLHDQFLANGVSSEYVDANTPREERLQIAARFTRGETKVICNIGTMTTGIDLDVRCLIFARPTKSESLYVQIIGRALRTAPGKSFATIFDHSDTTRNLGFVTAIGIDALDTGKPGAGDATRTEKTVPLPRECAACHCLVPAGSNECPNCGKVMKRKSDVDAIDGELAELGGPKRGEKTTLQHQLSKLPAEELFGQIAHIRDERRWKDGRAAHLYRSIRGAWPNTVKNSQPRPPSAELLAYVRYQQIAFAKSREAQAKRSAEMRDGV